MEEIVDLSKNDVAQKPREGQIRRDEVQWTAMSISFKRISMKDGAQCVNLVSGNSAAAYDVRCAFDEEHNEWLYVISMPEKDKMVLEEICKGYKIKVEDLVRQFYLWVMREPEAAAQWLKGETERKKV